MWQFDVKHEPVWRGLARGEGRGAEKVIQEKPASSCSGIGILKELVACRIVLQVSLNHIGQDFYDLFWAFGDGQGRCIDFLEGVLMFI